MNRPRKSGPRNDPYLLLEAGLVVLLIAFFIVLYVVPTERRLQGVPWWSPIILGGLALSLLVVDVRRRKRRGRREMKEMIDDHLGPPL